MARVEKKDEKKTEYLIVKIGLLFASVALIAFLVTLLVLNLVKNDDEEEDPFENYMTVTTTEVSKIIQSEMGSSSADNKYQDLREANSELYDLLMHDSSKQIYILIHSTNQDDYAKIQGYEDKNEENAKRMEEAILQTTPDSGGDFIFLLVDYKVSTDIFTTLSTLLPDDINKEALKLGAPYLLTITTSEETGEDASFIGYSGKQNFDNMLSKLSN